jgi:hypothetical protein
LVVGDLGGWVQDVNLSRGVVTPTGTGGTAVARVGTNGVFAFEPLPAGRYQLRVTLPRGYELLYETGSLDIDPGQDCPLVIYARYSSSVEGRVVMRGARPSPGCRCN